MTTGEGLLITLGGSRWSISASDASSVIRGASVSLSVEVAELTATDTWDPRPGGKVPRTGGGVLCPTMSGFFLSVHFRSSLYRRCCVRASGGLF